MACFDSKVNRVGVTGETESQAAMDAANECVNACFGGEMSNKSFLPPTVLVAILSLAACDSQAPEDPRSELVRTVRELVADLGFEPHPDPPAVRTGLVALGQALAFDKILSGNRNIGCMTCHLPEMATGDGRTLSAGEGGSGLATNRSHPDDILIPRNSPAAINLLGGSRVFWDGRVQKMPDGSMDTPAKDQLTSEMADVFEFGAISARGRTSDARR